MDQIKRINHSGLRVRDLDVARAFYEKLGSKLIIGPVGPEPVAVMEHPAGSKSQPVVFDMTRAPIGALVIFGLVP